jgi:glycosyltransferase involved in cell wall biosynthesis
LGAIASTIVGVWHRIYSLQGLRLETTTGIKHTILFAAEKLTAVLSHKIIATSPSLEHCYLSKGLTYCRKIKSLHRGSLNGICIGRFDHPDNKTIADTLRHKWKIPSNARCIGFVGRLNKDKGIAILLQVYLKLLKHFPSLYLLLVGDFEEEGDGLDSSCVEQIKNHPQIIVTGLVANSAPYYHLMEVMAFPSLREGFGCAIVEAGIAKIPVVGFRVTGVIDAIEDKQNGTLVDRGDIDHFHKAIECYLNNPLLASKHGNIGYHRTNRLFASDIVCQKWVMEYQKILSQH